MVYSTIRIVLGVAASLKDITTEYDLEIRSLGNLERSEHCVIVESIKDHDSVKAGEGNEQYLVGVEMNKYWRYIRVEREDENTCTQCKKYSCCNECLGATINGVYDVCAMAESPVEVNIRHVCMRCFADNRKDLMSPLKDVPVVGKGSLARCVEDPIATTSRLKCNTCGVKPDWRFSPQTLLKRNYIYEQLKPFLENYPNLKNKEIKLYYLLNDCLCCT